MMLLYPANAVEALEFNKVSLLLKYKCRTDAARERMEDLRFHTRLDYVEREMVQTSEFKAVLQGGDHFPNDFIQNVQKELKLIQLPGAVLNEEQLMAIQQLALNAKDILQWFRKQNDLFPNLKSLTDKTVYEKKISDIINGVIDESAHVRDTASKELMRIRSEMASRRNEVRKAFEAVLRKLNKLRYLADISEAFINNRRVVAVLAENKRIVKGILHGESDSQKTVFIEPEDTIELNNTIASLERAEIREIQRILAQTTALLSVFHTHLSGYYHLCGLFDFIRAKALLAIDMNACMPRLSPHPGLELIKAYHPLLYLHNKQQNKPTVPLNIRLDKAQRILIISGPNAGGKTVSMKTTGLLQLMAQAGLLIPAAENSEIGIFKHLMIQIGDTQSIEHELSTYSAHLRDMKYFMDYANGKTLFFIDELGSGSDPNLGGAFAEAIVEEMASKHAIGIITTHYLYLKVMAGKVPGIVNGAMAFDEVRLEPLYQLNIGKPGSSYTFAIAQRSGLSPQLINRARELTQREHFSLDKMLLQTEQQSVKLKEQEKELNKLLKENAALKTGYEELINTEKLKQQHETLKLQNKIKKEELDYLRDTERKFKQIIQDWKKADDKQDVIDAAENVLFKRKQLQGNVAASKKADKNYEVTGTTPRVGDLVRNKTNHQIGTVSEVRDRRAIVQIGNLPFNVNLDDWLVVRKKEKK